MSRKTVVISINAAWNIFNFRKELLLALREAGYRVVALAPQDEFSARLAELGVEYVPIQIDNQGVSPAKDLLLLARYRRALRKIGADLFLGYTIKPNIYGSIAARLCGIPVINNISGLGTAFIRRGILTRIVTNLYRLALGSSATVFFQNRDDRDLFVGKRIVRADQAALLPGSGIDLERFAPRFSARGPDAPFCFLYLGRLLWDKGIREFVEAAQRVRISHPEARFQLLGFVDVPNRTAVARSDIDGWSAEGLVEYLPASDDVRPHIAEADCIVLPSYREGLPRALLEGAAMGKPLIATDVPGCRDVVDNEQNGFLCAVRDPGSLADAMSRMIELDDETRALMGARGRAKVEESFSHQLVVNRYLSAVEDALA